MYESAISLDSACARAHTGIAGALLLDWISGWGDLKVDTLGIALAKAKVALELDDSDLKTRWNSARYTCIGETSNKRKVTYVKHSSSLPMIQM